MIRLATLLAPSLLLLFVAATQGPPGQVIVPLPACDGCVASTDYGLPEWACVIIDGDEGSSQVIRNLKINGSCAEVLPGSCMQVSGCLALVTATLEILGGVVETISAGVNVCGASRSVDGEGNGCFIGSFYVEA